MTQPPVRSPEELLVYRRCVAMAMHKRIERRLVVAVRGIVRWSGVGPVPNPLRGGEP